MKKLVLILVPILLIASGLATFVRTADAAPGGDPVISGTGRVGETLTIASYGALSGEGDYAYTWLWEGEEVPGPMDHDASHIVTTADLGHELSVLIKPKRGDAERLASNRIAARPAALAGPRVGAAGSAKVGRTLSATVSGGTPGAAVAYQWLRDGAAISGATGVSYRLVKADGGRSVSVRTTSSQPGKTSVLRDSAVRRVAAFNARRPRLKGAAKVGKTLKATRGTWNAPSHRYSYQWSRNGSTISRATKPSYRLRAKDRGKRITVVVRARKPGFPTVSAASGRSAKIR